MYNLALTEQSHSYVFWKFTHGYFKQINPTQLLNQSITKETICLYIFKKFHSWILVVSLEVKITVQEEMSSIKIQMLNTNITLEPTT